MPVDDLPPRPVDDLPPRPVDDLPPDRALLARLAGSRFARVTYLAETTSTNTVLAGEAAAGAPEGTVLVAGYQTRGKGRLDRTWQAPPGTCLLVSVLLRPPAAQLPASRRHLAVAALSLSVRSAAARLSGAEIRLKWPNDVVAAVPGEPEKLHKLSGVLAEAAGGDALVVGAGINVSWSPPGLPATCLEQLAGRPVSRSDLLVGVLEEMDRLYGHWDEVARLYARNCATVGRAVLVERGGGEPALRGTAEGLGPDGALLVRDRDGALVRVVAGDVVHAGLL